MTAPTTDRTPRPQPSTPGTPTAGDWLRKLTLVALDGQRPGTLWDVAAVIGAATGSAGVVLWETPEFQPDAPQPEPSVLSVWLQYGVPTAHTRSTVPDDLTRQAYATRNLALPSRAPAECPSMFGLKVDAAVPVDYADGSSGALTLLGGGGLTDDGFDTVAELLSILPQILTVRRERCTLALVNTCNQVLHDADVESPTEPLGRGRLRTYFAQICTEVAGALSCADVSILLNTPAGAGEAYTCFASSVDSATPPQRAVPISETPPPPRVTSDRTPLIEVPLTSGDHAWGLLRCEEALGPPFHFTRSDLQLLYPVAAQIASYWANWLHRRTIALENASWRRLAAGITEFNTILAQELRNAGGQQSQRQELLAEAALQLVQDVVPEAIGGVVHVASKSDSRTSLVEVAAAPAHQQEPGVLAQAKLAYETGRHHVEADSADRAGGWTVSTPIRVGDRAYGTLTAIGQGNSLPANSVQICEIMSDQLGLYRHLEHTLTRLHEARLTLKASLRGQAEAMEDLKHQLVSPLRTATDRTDLVLRLGRLDSRAQAQLRAVRGLCRKASRVALSAGVFAELSKDQLPRPRNEVLGVDDLLRMLIAAADDAQLLGDPKRHLTFDVDRGSIQSLHRQLVHADISFLQQCVGNLLDNAAKYSYSDTKITIYGAVTDGELALQVSNTGTPIAPADSTRCLERNWRGTEARNWTGEGSGIGLWIVDNLMRAMKGRVEIEPDAEKTTARLLLPVA